MVNLATKECIRPYNSNKVQMVANFPASCSSKKQVRMKKLLQNIENNRLISILNPKQRAFPAVREFIP